VINHDNEEGIIRIADTTVMSGLKMWRWGFPSFTHETDARKDPNPLRPYVELWAGVSDQFFHRAKFLARGEVSIPETYSPTVGIRSVTHATRISWSISRPRHPASSLSSSALSPPHRCG
jgi:hypothetical protein